ncbi:MAG: hypothetical protein WEB09_01230 [Nitriliruptor sp.]
MAPTEGPTEHTDDPTDRAEDPKNPVSGLIGRGDEDGVANEDDPDAPNDAGSQTGKAIERD